MHRYLAHLAKQVFKFLYAEATGLGMSLSLQPQESMLCSLVLLGSDRIVNEALHVGNLWRHMGV